jgi:hypothetical protein
MSDNVAEITGKKIFFLYPTASVQNQIIAELIQHEYEVYIAKDHSRLFRALKKYSDSILYINIDEKIPENEWEKWISGVHTAMPDINIGIFSASTDEDLPIKYINKLHAKCGFFSLKLDMSKIAEQVLEILNAMNVKGRRKYIRATVESEPNAVMNMPFDGDFINGNIRDISIVGTSCAFDHDPDLTKNSLLRDIQMKLHSMLLKVEAVVFGSRKESGEKKYVFLFTQRIDPDVRVKIRKYIQASLQSLMDHEINGK